MHVTSTSSEEPKIPRRLMRPRRAVSWALILPALLATVVAEQLGVVPDGVAFLLIGVVMVYGGLVNEAPSQLVLGGWMGGMGSTHLAQWLGKHVLTKLLLALVVTLLVMPAAAHAELACQPNGCNQPCTTTVTCENGGTQEIWCGCSADYWYTCLPKTECTVPDPPRLSQALKDQAQVVGNVMTGVGGTMGALAAVAAMSPDANTQIAGTVVGIMGVGISTLGDIVKATDPYDPLYWEVAAPNPQPLAYPYAALRRGVREPLRLLAMNQAELEATFGALQTAINRANSALKDGHKDAEQLQVTAIARYVAALSELFTDEVVLRKRLKTAWVNAGYRTIWNTTRTAQWPGILVNANLVAQYQTTAALLSSEVAP
jgi:hypothetical protein